MPGDKHFGRITQELKQSRCCRFTAAYRREFLCPRTRTWYLTRAYMGKPQYSPLPGVRFASPKKREEKALIPGYFRLQDGEAVRTWPYLGGNR
jgi:hypothetical protein